MPNMDYSELLAEMKRNGYTQKTLAEAVNITPSHFSRKLSGEYVFTQDEMRNILFILNLDIARNISRIFFTPRVEKTQQT